MAGEKTRQKLRDFGLPPEITEKPGLTLDEAYAALNDAREEERELAYGEPPDGCALIENKEDETEVVGESHYTKALVRAFTDHMASEHCAYCWAVLVREPSNKHDANAIMVQIDGRKAGYISRDIAKALAEFLDYSKPIACKARIYTRDESVFGVWLEAGPQDIFNAAADDIENRLLAKKELPPLLNIKVLFRPAWKAAKAVVFIAKQTALFAKEEPRMFAAILSIPFVIIAAVWIYHATLAGAEASGDAWVAVKDWFASWF